MTQTLVFIMELIGTAAFAVSGAMTGIRKQMDLFGVAVLGLTTAVGGGVIRDLVLGVTPPMTFRNPVYAVVAIAVSLVVFLPQVRRALQYVQHGYDLLLLGSDSLGLGIFTVVGVQGAFRVGMGDNLFLCIFVGTVTGIGGGIMRDIMAQERPVVFEKHFYGCARILGALFCALLWKPLGSVGAMFLGTALVVLLRSLAARYRWNLPRAK
ncbi:MAG: TRIC cation channel family protein [Oscillospiraceae bacterium]|nr:TRIC cation channel family protein [Oscillospiraceae bacterium]